MARQGRKGRDGDVGLSLGVGDECGRQFGWRTTERVEQVPAWFAGGCEYCPDDGSVSCTGAAAAAAGDLLLHPFGTHARFGSIIAGWHPGIDCEPQHRVPMLAQSQC